MKHILHICFICAAMSACTNANEESALLESSSPPTTPCTHINKTQAAEIALQIIGNNHNSRGIVSNATFDYILKKKHNSRSASNLSDTIAYIINYPNNQGFAIIASDSRVYPILAFSNKGNFSFDNEISTANFVDKIEQYMEAECLNGEKHSIDDEFLDGCWDFKPSINTSISQETPFNKYVTQEHPNCPAGCVAVATALVMTHTLHNLSYHNSFFNFTSIRNAFITETQEDNTPNNSPSKIAGGYVVYPSEVKEVYSFSQAVDSIAKMLYWIGKDVNMQYSTTVSGAKSSSAHSLLKQLKFDVLNDLSMFNIDEICSHLKNDCIIYMSGADVQRYEGHAWVCDGGYFCEENSGELILDKTFLHFDWGWGGNNNGYYQGRFFNVGKYSFSYNQYFAIKRHI